MTRLAGGDLQALRRLAQAAYDVCRARGVKPDTIRGKPPRKHDRVCQSGGSERNFKFQSPAQRALFSRPRGTEQPADFVFDLARVAET
jgi:hypothetical protein